MNTLNKYFISSGLTITFLCSIFSSNALAAFIRKGPAIAQKNFFQVDFEWDFANGAVNPIQVPPGPPGPFPWLIQLESMAAGGGNENLELRVRHLDGPHPPGDIDTDPNPMPPGFHVVNQNNLSRPPVGGLNQQTTLRQFKHPTNKADHYDTIGLTTSIQNVGAVDVKTRGVHTETKKAAASYQAFLSGLVNVNVKKRNGEEEKRVEDQLVNPDGNTIIPLTDPNDASIPTSYEVIFTQNSTTSVSLAFPGAFDEIPGRIDLDAGFQFFETFDTEIIAPLLLDISSTPEDLFIGIDLGEWLDFQTSFNAFDEFEVIGGRSEMLPGYIFSTSPLMDGPNGEFLAAPQDLWTGTGFVAVEIDGRSQTVPESTSTLSLLALSSLGMASTLKRKINHPKSSEKETKK